MKAAVVYARSIPHEVKEGCCQRGSGWNEDLEGRELPVGENVVYSVDDADEGEEEGWD